MALQRAQASRPAKRFESGDSLAFRSLMSRFDMAVNDEAIDDASRLIELFHWFEGSAATMIDSFAALPDAVDAYARAREELDKVFGASSDSVVPLIRVLLAGNAAKEDDHPAHLLLYSQLVTADTTATALGQRHLLDRFDYCAEIIEKRLPYLARKWWRKDHDHQEDTGLRYSFGDLKDFVSVATKICASRQNLKKASVFKCNAQDLQQAPPQPKKPNQQGQQNQQKPQGGNGQNGKPSFAKTVRDSPTKEQQQFDCMGCGSKGHDTFKCPLLLALPMDQRSEKFRERKACFGCASLGHTRPRCPNPPTCGKCGKPGHNELFCGRKFTPRPSAPNQNAPSALSINASSFTPATTPANVIDIAAAQPTL